MAALLAASTATCPPEQDRAFGPRVDPSCRSFDFTLQFEDVFLACLPATIFLLLIPAQTAYLLRRPIACSSNSKLLIAKLVALSGLITTQLAFLILRTQHAPLQTGASVAADVLPLLAAIAASVLSFLDHQRSLRPSTLLSLYLAALILLGIARVRTLWLITDAAAGGAPAALTANFVFAVISLLAESVERKKAATQVDWKAASPEQLSGFWNRTAFAWLAATFRAGYAKILTLADLPPLDTQLQSHVLLVKLQAAWAKYDQRKRNSLLRATFAAHLPSVLSPILPRLCQTAFTFVQPFLIETTVNFAGDPEADANYGRGLVGAWALVLAGRAASTAVYRYQLLRSVTRIRGSLQALIYSRALRARAVDSGPGSVTAVSLVGTDVPRIGQSGAAYHETWASVLDVGVAIWLLQRQMGAACVAPLALVVLFAGAMYMLTGMVKRAQTAWIERVQERLRVTAGVLADMKAVKMLGLSDVVAGVIQRARAAEIRTSSMFRKLLVATLLLSNIPKNLAPVVTFLIYVIIAVNSADTTLLAAQAFTSVALISLLTMPVLIFIQAIPAMFECLSCFDRIQEFCNYATEPEPIQDDADLAGTPQGSASGVHLKTLPDVKSRDRPGGGSLVLKDANFGWDRNAQMFLKDLSITIGQGKMTAVVGPVGSGKTTFLLSILGETISSTAVEEDSSSRRPLASTAFCAQEAWLEKGTIRSNIVGVSPLDRAWYDTVVHACGLVQDFREMARGDRTEVGSKGLNLSGGQKQRIALARAVYARSSLFILDDVFSGMDAHTTAHVSRALLGPEGLLRRGDRSATTVLLATHNRDLMGMADAIIAFEDGRIVESGEPGVLAGGDGYVGRLGLSLVGNGGDGDRTGEIMQVASSETSRLRPEEGQLRLSMETDLIEEEEELQQDLRRRQGDPSVYRYYLSSSGYTTVVLLLIFMILWVFCSEFPTIWLKIWSEANVGHPNDNIGMYMGVFAMLGVLGTIFVSLACWYAFVRMISESGYRLHRDLLETMLRAPIRFFTENDNGVLTNRFSQDMELIDMALPDVMLNYVSACLTCFTKLIILAIFSQFMAASVPPLATAVYLLQRFYLRTSRQLRLLEIEAKAPLFTHVLESASSPTGTATIRAFKWQRPYLARNAALVDAAQGPVYVLACVQLWLAFVLDGLIAVVAVALVGTVAGWRDRFSEGGVGVSLVMVMSFSLQLAKLVETWTQMEGSIGAVARVKRFVEETEAEDKDDDEGRLVLGREVPEGWPSRGKISIEGLVAAHKPGADPVLKGITLAIKPGQHIAICGRSGSGKSSLLLSLLRMTDLLAGTVTIDGVDITSVPRSVLRGAALNAVPQDVCLIPGSTVRFNLDPFGAADASAGDDADIMAALKRVGMWDVVAEQGGLDRVIDVEAWSAGQKQLLCLARALVRRRRRTSGGGKEGGGGGVLVLDEAASSVDAETEGIMQDIIESEFKGVTVLAVMHRLRHVGRYDGVVVLDRGMVVEYDAPEALLARESRFAALYHSGAH